MKKSTFFVSAFLLAGGLAFSANADVNIVKTIDLTFENAVAEGYDLAPCEFDLDEVLDLLDCESIDDTALISIAEDGSVISTYTANYGYWYDFDGAVCNWGEDAAWFVEYYGYDPEDLRELTVFGIGNMEGVFDVKGSCNIGFQNGDNIVLFNISVTITPADTPDTPVGDVEVVKTIDLNFNNTVEGAYDAAPCEFDLDEVLDLLGCESIDDTALISIAEDGSVISTYTANYGYWYDFDGAVCFWGEDAAWYVEYYGYDPEDDEDLTTFWIGNMDGVFDAEGSCNIGFLYEGSVVLFNINVSLSEETGIDSIFDNASETFNVYNTQGMLVKRNARDFSGLSNGIYIANGKKFVIRK